MPRLKPILCVNTGVVYSSMSEASKSLDIHKSQISHQLAGERSTANGLVFVKINGNESVSELEKIIASSIQSHYKISVRLNATLSEDGELDG